MAALVKPEVPAGPVRVLFDELHDLHHRAGWPSLRDIAQQQLGNASRWPEIFERNRDVIDDPDRIFPDQALILPT